MIWPWNMGLGSFKVIENGAVRQTMYDFLLVRHCNYRSVLYGEQELSCRKQIARHLRTQYVEGIYRPNYPWPWLGQGSLKVTVNRTIRQIIHDLVLIELFNGEYYLDLKMTTYDFLLVHHCNYSSVLYRFRVAWRWIISWPWNLA